MSTVGLVVHPYRRAAQDLAAHTVALLSELGHKVVRLGDGQAGPLPVDVIVSLGGDGTMLRSVNLAGPLGIPVLGVHLGHLGYLTPTEPDGLDAALLRLVAGDYRVDSRMTLDVRVAGGLVADDPPPSTVLNDVVLLRRPGSHLTRVTVTINGRLLSTYAADAVIVATPTGSTAYNLSAHGPIVSPAARVQLVTAVAPLSLFDRTLVIDASERAALSPIDGAADLMLDGREVGTVEPGQIVRCAPGARDALLVKLDDDDFPDILRRKFDLA